MHNRISSLRSANRSIKTPLTCGYAPFDYYPTIFNLGLTGCCERLDIRFQATASISSELHEGWKRICAPAITGRQYNSGCPPSRLITSVHKTPSTENKDRLSLLLQYCFSSPRPCGFGMLMNDLVAGIDHVSQI